MKQDGKTIKGLKIGNLQFLSSSKEVTIILQIIIILKYVLFAAFFYSTLLLFLDQFSTKFTFIQKLIDLTLEYLHLLFISIKNAFGVILGIIVLYILMRIIFLALNYLLKHYREIPGEFNNLSKKGYIALIGVIRKIVMILFVLGVIYLIPATQVLAFILFVIFVLIIGLSLVNPLRDLFAGYILMAKGIFRIGDKIKVQEMVGIVKDRNFLFTTITTDVGEAILHNSLILSKPIIVYKKTLEVNDE